MFAHLLQARLGAAARIATTAVLALLLLVAGWTPARVLPTLASGHAAQAAGSQAGAETAQLAAGLRAVAATPAAADPSLDAGLPAGRRPLVSSGSAAGSGRRPASLAGRPAAGHRPRGPPTTV